MVKIWSVRKKDSRGYLAFQSLNSLKVGNCASLKYLFPASVAKGLVQLKVLEIFDCGVEEIVANENGLEEVPIFLFPRLTSLKLTKLYQLKRFYRDKYTLGCPLLKTLVVCNCDEVELLLQEKSLEGEVDKQPLFLIEKNTFPNVEELELVFKGPVEISWGQFSRESFGKLRVLEIEVCHDISVVIPHNIEQLIVRRCYSVEKVIQVEGHGGETLPRLTIMCLDDLPMLRHLSGLGSILQNLQSLQVFHCDSLINLVSPSMAKRLVQLKELTVRYCGKVKEIVENEGGEATDDEILFTKLQKLNLSFLPNLKSFCSARYTFKFPCLIEMQVTDCPKMEFFCKEDSITESSQRVELGYYGQRWENDLNTTIQKMFMETNAEPMEEDFEEYWDFKELDPKEEDSEDEVPDEEDDEEGDSEEQHPNVEDSEGRSGSLGPRS
ncbi:hypothetical protein AAG906_002238 [Vitis piasezkii]